ncbi:CNNM domain-containing protein [Roseateles sp. SL47]|uniref:CNNM domain-containing protein n=1 Tax=Roseateles sp. SL47 TaxID=2995138 RepID=UPI003B63268E
MPKRLGQSNPEAVARRVAKPLAGLAIATQPFVVLLSGSTKALLRLLGVKDNGAAITHSAALMMLLTGKLPRVAEVVDGQHWLLRDCRHGQQNHQQGAGKKDRE